MLELFYEYLIHYQKIVLPGLGTVVLQRKSAMSDITDHTFSAPSYSYQWEHDDHNIPANFFTWLSHKLSLTEEDVAIRVNHFISDLKKEMNAGKEIIWNGVGII